jgi:hypothetical protein
VTAAREAFILGMRPVGVNPLAATELRVTGFETGRVTLRWGWLRCHTSPTPDAGARGTIHGVVPTRLGILLLSIHSFLSRGHFAVTVVSYVFR